MLCYLCLVDRSGLERNPFSVRQYDAFCAYIRARYKTFAWLAPMRAVPSFFLPMLCPLIVLLLALAWPMSPLSLAIATAVISSVEVFCGGLAGWIITGTQPNWSSEAANYAQNMLMDLTEDYSAAAYYLLDLYASELKVQRFFAEEVAAACDTDKLEDAMVALIPRYDPSELEDPLLCRGRFRRLLQPLREVVAYICSQGSIVPVDANLRVRIEVSHIREELHMVLARQAIVREHGAATGAAA